METNKMNLKELDQALRDGRADLTVHSLKDMPMGVPEELPLDFKTIAHLFSLTPTAEAEKPLDRLKKMMEEAGITEEQI